MNYKDKLDETAHKLKLLLQAFVDAQKIETEDFGWNNDRYISENFRIAHIERYSDNNLNVLHFTCFPNTDCPDPIFGFDIITTEKKCLAAFLDWSTVVSDVTYKSPYNFSTNYKLPDWANEIFSKDFIAIIPNDDEFLILLDIVIDSFSKYLILLLRNNIRVDKLTEIKTKHNNYCDNQQKNERTYNVLKSKLGEKRAKYFMSEILFPKIK